MGDLDRLINVQVDKQTAAVSRVGFGTPMIMSTEAFVDSKFGDVAKVYTALDELGATGDAYDPTGVTFLMAQAAFAQSPKISQLVIGKRANAPLMTVELTPIVVNDTLYRVTINGTDFDFTSDATATDLEIIAGLVALINGGTEDVLATDDTTFMTIEKAVTPGGVATAGIPFTLEFSRPLWASQNVTPDPGVVTDLSTIRTDTTGNDDWYAVMLDSYGNAEIQSLAPTIETLPRIFLACSSDADIVTSSVADLASDLLAVALDRTALIWHENPHKGAHAAWGGAVLPFDPGSITWAYQSLATIPFSALTPAETLELESKKTTWYKRIAGNNVTFQGETFASGGFLDVTRGIDFVVQRIKENLFIRLVNLPKIPYTDAGIAVVQAVVQGVMDLAVGQSIFTDDPAPLVSVPKANDADANDRALRILRNVTFDAQLAGAIHKITVFGTVTV